MDWDDLRYFLAVAREGQMLGAARRLGVSQAMLSRHLAALEEATGARLLDRTTRGCTLTAEGEALMETAERVEATVLSGMARLGGAGSLRGTLRIGAPDGFGGAWLAPRVHRFQMLHPGLTLQLVPVARALSLSEREADMAVMVGRPAKGRLRVRKLTDYALGLYAAKGYLDRHPAPTGPEALRDHALVGYVEDLIYAADLAYASEIWRDWRSGMQIATAIGQLEAVRAGAGIGVLHRFMAATDAALVPVLPDLLLRRAYWLVWHENLDGAPKVRAFTDWLAAEVGRDRGAFLGDPTGDQPGT